MAGAVLCTLNARHDSSMVSTLVRHSEAKFIFVDRQLLEIALGALRLLSQLKDNTTPAPSLVILTDDSKTLLSLKPSNAYEYKDLLSIGTDKFETSRPNSEWDLISINYTSGATSCPKAIVYNHRGAYLNSLSTVLLHGMGQMPVYLWTVPMFHCNCWCLIWGSTAQGATNIFIRKATPNVIFDNTSLRKVTHMGSVPIVLTPL